MKILIKVWAQDDANKWHWVRGWCNDESVTLLGVEELAQKIVTAVRTKAETFDIVGDAPDAELPATYPQRKRDGNPAEPQRPSRKLPASKYAKRLAKPTDFERYMLTQAVPCLALPELVNPTDADLWERAHAVGYGQRGLTSRGDGNLTALYKVLGVVPASDAERRAVVR